MLNYDAYYRAENDYRREVLRRDWRPLRTRRAVRGSARNQLDPAQRGDLAS
ncbi:MAG: hypothetical protein ACJ72D_07940 [Marmoricola sp.]